MNKLETEMQGRARQYVLTLRHGAKGRAECPICEADVPSHTEFAREELLSAANHMVNKDDAEWLERRAKR